MLGLVGQLQALGLSLGNLGWQVPQDEAEAAGRKARLQALAALQQEALSAARTLGLSVQGYQSIDLTGGPSPIFSPGAMPQAQMAAAMAPPLASADSQNVSATVSADVILATKPPTNEGSAMSATIEVQTYDSLSDIPRIDIPQNLSLALATKRHVVSILREILALWHGPGKLTPQEYFYYRLWDPAIPFEEKRRFVGKHAQNAMHLTCNSQYWYCAAADKILFHTIMAGAAMPIPDLIAISAEGRAIPGIPNLTDAGPLASLLRRPEFYPLFMKEVAGKYSLSVISADSYDPAADEVLLLDGKRLSPESLAEKMITPRGYLVQRRLRQAPALAALFGPRLWSVRVFVTLGKAGPRIHRATAKIATGNNPADNYWRRGNMLGAIDLESGQILRTVFGSSAELRVNDSHPDTGRPIVGAQIPDWNLLKETVLAAAPIFAGIHSQSWDVALTEQGPVLLEVNFGGDLNLTQLATGKGVLDADYSIHLKEWGYHVKSREYGR